jgi:hypothetical protein
VSGREHEVRVHPRLYHVKPGYKTTEFYVALLVVLVASAIVLLQTHRSGLDPNGAIALASAALTSFGYSRGRSSVKSGN